MQWLFPAFLAALGALALPALLHFLRRRPKRTVVFPSLRFLAPTIQQNAHAQRIQRWLVLLLRCLVLGLIALAFARPYFADTAPNKRRAVVVVVDSTFSQQAEGRWKTLQAWGQNQLGRTAAQDRVGILQVGRRPTWLAPLTTSAADAAVALGQLAPGWDTARLEPALRLAGQTLAATPADRREIIVLTDHQRVSWSAFNFAEKLPAGVSVRFPEIVPVPARQAALHHPRVVRKSTGFAATVTVANYGRAQTRRLRLYRDGLSAPVYEQAIDLGEQEQRSIQLDVSAGDDAKSAYFRFTLDEDDLSADDTAYAVWQAEGERVVLLDTMVSGSAADYVRTALEAAADVGSTFRVQSPPTSPWPADAVAILRHPASFRGEPVKRLNDFLRSGGSAVVFMNETVRTWFATNGGIQARPLLAGDTLLDVRDWAWDHVLVKDLASHSIAPLLGWDFHRGWALPGDTVDPIALWPDGGVAIGETSSRPGHVLICGFQPDRRDGEWPAREAFLPFVHRAVEYLFGSETVSAIKPFRVGERIPLPADIGSWKRLAGPMERKEEVLRTGVATPEIPGVYAFASGGLMKLFAVNLALEESDLEPWRDGTPWESLEAPADETTAAQTVTFPVAALEAEQQRTLWWWLFLAVAVALLTELAIANRTSR